MAHGKRFPALFPECPFIPDNRKKDALSIMFPVPAACLPVRENHIVHHRHRRLPRQRMHAGQFISADHVHAVIANADDFEFPAADRAQQAYLQSQNGKLRNDHQIGLSLPQNARKAGGNAPPGHADMVQVLGAERAAGFHFRPVVVVVRRIFIFEKHLHLSNPGQRIEKINAVRRQVLMKDHQFPFVAVHDSVPFPVILPRLPEEAGNRLPDARIPQGKPQGPLN